MSLSARHLLDLCGAEDVIKRDDGSRGHQETVTLPILTVIIDPRAVRLLEIDKLRDEVCAPIVCFSVLCGYVRFTIGFERARRGLKIVVVRGRPHTRMSVEVIILLNPS